VFLLLHSTRTTSCGLRHVIKHCTSSLLLNLHLAFAFVASVIVCPLQPRFCFYLRLKIVCPVPILSPSITLFSRVVIESNFTAFPFRYVESYSLHMSVEHPVPLFSFLHVDLPLLSSSHLATT